VLVVSFLGFFITVVLVVSFFVLVGYVFPRAVKVQETSVFAPPLRRKRMSSRSVAATFESAKDVAADSLGNIRSIDIIVIIRVKKIREGSDESGWDPVVGHRGTSRLRKRRRWISLMRLRNCSRDSSWSRKDVEGCRIDVARKCGGKIFDVALLASREVMLVKVDMLSYDGSAEAWDKDQVTRFPEPEARADVDNRFSARNTFILASLFATE